MRHHFLLQIVQANCSIIPDGLCAHSHFPTLHTVYSHGHLETAQKSLSLDGEFVEGPWKEVRGGVPRPPHHSLPSSAQEPFQVSPGSLENPSAPTSPPHKFPGLKSDMGPGSPARTHLQGSGSSGPDSALEVRDLPPKAWAVSLPARIPDPSSCPSPEVPVNWRWGRQPVPSCSPLPALHIWPKQRSTEGMEGMSAALSTQPPLPPPCTGETMGP